MAKNFESDRRNISIGYSILAVVLLATIACPLAGRIREFVAGNHEAVFRLAFSIFFGLFGLCARSWSFEKQGESPFPPYIFTYPSIVLGSCAAIATLPIEGYRFFFTAPIIAFIVGYLPMEAVDSIQKRLLG